jgi:uncharacterized integral membrane protein (TIGR00697 family)
LDRKSYLLLYITAAYVTALIVGVAIGSKLIAVFTVVASLSALTYPITFLVTDVVGEVWGRKAAQRIVLTGFGSLVLVIILFQLAIVIPGAESWQNDDAFNGIFGQSIRIALSGTLAYLIAQTHDVWAYSFWKRVTNGKHMWLRNNASTMVSQLIDTGIFVTLAFWGVAPLWELFIGQYLLKITLAALDTPIAYVSVGLIRSYIKEES